MIWLSRGGYMFFRYIKMIPKVLLRDKGFSIINILGLSLSISAALVIFLWVDDELNYNKFHDNYSNIYRMIIENRGPEANYSHPFTQAPLSKVLRRDYPEIETAAKFMWSDFMVSYRDNIYNEFKIAFADPEYFDIFSFPIIKGSSENPIPNTSSIAISHQMAIKYFGTEDPIGKVMVLDKKNDFVVSSVFYLPVNSDIDFDFYIAFDALSRFGVKPSKLEQQWQSLNYATFVLLKPNASVKNFSEKIGVLLEKHLPERDLYLGLQEFSKIHLYNTDGSYAQMKYVIGFSVIGIFLLVIACINYTNLSLVTAQKRAKEIGLRKTIGASRKQLISQHLTESMIIIFAAILLALILAGIFLPLVNHGLGKEITLNLLDWKIIFFVLIIWLTTSIPSNIYPSLVLTSFKPVSTIHGTEMTRGKKAILRQFLVVFQFIVSIGLIVSTIIVHNQLQFMRDKDLGYSKGNHFSIMMQGDSKYNYKLLKNELIKNPDIKNASACSKTPVNIPFRATGKWDGMQNGRIMHFAYIYADSDFLDTFGLELVGGKQSSTDISAETKTYYLNQTAIRNMGLEDPIGKSFTFMGETGKIYGIVKDFHFQSLEYPIRPIVIAINKARKKHFFVIRTEEGANQRDVIGYTHDIWNKINPGFSFEYSFLDDQYKNIYTNEKLLSTILSIFSILAIVISCLGVLGLTGSFIQSKMKEIGIRKVFGATVVKIIVLLFRNLSKLIVAAFLVTVPLSYYLSTEWLSGFSYRVLVNPLVFFIAFIMVYTIAVLITLYFVVRAAISNPIKILKYE